MISNACKILGNQEHFVPELELLELTPVVFGSVPVPWSFGKSRELNLGFICKVLCSVFDNKPPARDPLSPKNLQICWEFFIHRAEASSVPNLDYFLCRGGISNLFGGYSVVFFFF